MKQLLAPPGKEQKRPSGNLKEPFGVPASSVRTRLNKVGYCIPHGSRQDPGPVCRLDKGSLMKRLHAVNGITAAVGKKKILWAEPEVPDSEVKTFINIQNFANKAK